MNIEENPDRADAENRETDSTRRALEEGVPLSVRNARRMGRDLWPHLWMSFASILILAVTLAIVSYRIGAQSCH